VRNSSSTYLRRLADEGILSADATEHVRRASDAYRAAYREWQKAYGLVGHPAPEGSGRDKGKRLAASRAVLKALEHERAAVKELRAALREKDE
jgi:hypothetical protein